VGRALLRGITWHHRRAIDPLARTLPRFNRGHPDIDIVWDVRPLSGFEFAPVAGLAERYDLIVLDHPFAGDIAASRCLMPLDDLAANLLSEGFVGPSLESYRYGGRLWAIPIDAAAQVAVGRPDLMAELDAQAPARWDQVFALGERARRRGLFLATALKGVHSLMTFYTLCASQGRPCGIEPEQPFADEDAAERALGAMRRLLSYCPSDVLDWNSIALHDAMVAQDDLVYCPAVYGYATYAEADNRRPLLFIDLPGLDRESPAGSAVGGTGVGVSAGVADPEAAMTYVRFLGDDRTQIEFARHHGQPAGLEAWRDPELDARFGRFFSGTIETMRQAWVRPRYAGYLRFQAAAGELVEQHLRGAMDTTTLLDRLAKLHAAGLTTDQTRRRKP